MINKSTIQAVKEQTDIKDLIEFYGVELKRSGKNLMGKCPFHGDNSPSFSVSEDYGTYYCFGCGVKGDAISFVQESDGYDFSGAVEFLAGRLGIQVVSDGGHDPEYELKQRYLKAYETAAYFFRTQFNQLPGDHPAKENLEDRALLLDKSWMEKFGIGYAPEGFNNLTTYLTNKGFQADELVEFGLIAKSENRGTYYDKYRNRLIWEIRNIKGQVVGFGGRKLDPEDNPKYLNTQQTILYDKSNVLYGLDLSRKAIAKSKTCFVVEGYTDVMAMHAIGVENVVASSGTAFGTGHSSIIRRLIDDIDATKSGDFVFVFDGDAAGVKAALRVFEIEPSIKERSYVVPMNDGDPCDIRKSDGANELKDQLVRNRIPLTEFVLQQKMLDYDLSIAERKEEYLQEAYRILSTIKQSSLRDAYTKKVQLWTGVRMENRRPVNQPVIPQDEVRDQPRRAVQDPSSREAFERRAVSVFVQHPQAVFDVVARYNIDDCITNPAYNEILFDGMALVGAGEKMVAEDFRDRNLFVSLLAETVSANDVIVFAERQFQVLLRLNAEAERQKMQDEMAQKYRSQGQLTAEDLRAAFANPSKK